jgi:hypothetical protein
MSELSTARADDEGSSPGDHRQPAESALPSQICSRHHLEDRTQAARGHEKVPAGGQVRSPLVANKSPRAWPRKVPAPH